MAVAVRRTDQNTGDPTAAGQNPGDGGEDSSQSEKGASNLGCGRWLGDLYKCWNEIGMHTRSYGSIFGGNNRSNIDQWNNYQVASYEECRECAFLPVCMGGCPYRSISGGSKQCISVKYNYERLIRILAERVKKRNEKNTSIRN